MSSTFVQSMSVNADTTVTSGSSTALTVAASGTNYGLQVDESTASAATGLKIKPEAAGSGLALSVISSATDELLEIDAKGSGSIYLNNNTGRPVNIGNGAEGAQLDIGAISTTLYGLRVSGTPAASTAGNGAQPQAALVVTGTTGQATTGTTGQVGGPGGGIALYGGAGGNAPSGSENGRGGDVEIAGGAGGSGAGSSPSNPRGDVNLQPQGGRVGIGTFDPGKTLDVFVPNGDGIFVRDSSTTSMLAAMHRDNTNGVCDQRAAGTVKNRFHAGGDSYITGGNVGIGTTTPGSRLDLDAGALTMAEMTAPSAPGTNKCVIYAEDNGSGKTRLMVKFATGAAQQIAIEP